MFSFVCVCVSACFGLFVVCFSLRIVYWRHDDLENTAGISDVRLPLSPAFKFEVDDISVHFGILTDQVPQRLGCVPSVLVCNRATKVSLSQTGQRLSLQVSLGQTGHGLGKRSPPVRAGCTINLCTVKPAFMLPTLQLEP